MGDGYNWRKSDSQFLVDIAPGLRSKIWSPGRKSHTTPEMFLLLICAVFSYTSRNGAALQGHPVYKNPHFRPKSLGVMHGPPHFGELRVLTHGDRFTCLGAPRVLHFTIFFGWGTQDLKFFKIGFFL